MGAIKIFRFVKKISDFLIPSVCAVCGNVYTNSNSTPICEACWVSFLPDDMAPLFPVPGRLYSFTKFRARYLMNEEMRKALHALKYGRMPSIGKRFGWEIGSFIPIDFWSTMDGVVAVPLFHSRKRTRGYNQSEYIALGFSESTGLPILRNGLRRIRFTGTQTSLDKLDRAANIADAFVADRSVVEGKRVIVVDDVATTGSTTDECAKALLKAGALEVRVSSAARA